MLILIRSRYGYYKYGQKSCPDATMAQFLDHHEGD